METMPKTLPDAFRHLEGKPVTIVALGDSNTEQNHWTYGHCNWVGLLQMGLTSIFPQRLVINAGRGGEAAGEALMRLDRDVLRFDPDVVIVGYGSNDVSRGITPEEFKEQMRTLIQRIRRHNPECVVILRTPPPMIDMFTGYELKEYCGRTSAARNEFAEKIAEVAEEEKTLLVDHNKRWRESMKSSCHGDLCTLMGNPVHPNHTGHRRLYYEIAGVFNAYPDFFFEWERILIDQDILPGKNANRANPPE